MRESHGGSDEPSTNTEPASVEGAATGFEPDGEPRPTESAHRRYATLGLRLSIAAVVLALLYSRGWLDPSSFRALRLDGWLLGTIALPLGVLLLPPIRWWLLCRGRSLPVSLGAIYHVSFLGALAGRLLFGALTRDLVRLAYMSRLHPEQRALALSTVVVDRYVGSLALFALGPLTLGVLWLRGVREPWLTSSGLLLGALFVGLLLLPWIASSPRTAFLLGPLRKKKIVQELYQALIGYRGKTRVLAAALGISFIIHGTYLAACCCAVAALGYPLDALGVCTVAPLILLSSQVPLTPGGLGIKEGVAAELFRLAGMSGGAEMSLLIRAVMLSQTLLCLPALLFPVGGPKGQSLEAERSVSES